MQLANRKIALFKNLDDGFADSTGGADNGDVKGLAHAKTSGKTGSGTLTVMPGAGN
jgi:hypothetical protein